jgi:hypothetical protein
MPVDFIDIEATEPDYYKVLRQISETPLDLLMMDLTFSAETQKFGNTEVIYERRALLLYKNIPVLVCAHYCVPNTLCRIKYLLSIPETPLCSFDVSCVLLILSNSMSLILPFLAMSLSGRFADSLSSQVVDLVPNGRNIAVTDDNKSDYIRLVAHHRMTAAIRSQIDAFLQGFYDLVPAELVCIFSPTELELLICGLPDVNIEELQQQTDYHQYKASDEVIVWFWDALKSLNREERASFLQFVTGTSKVTDS